jgi:Spy/CpxP family protein refolding chaperone
MKRRSKLALVLAGTLVVVGFLSACRHHHDAEYRSQWMIDKVTRKLELDAEQQAKLQQVNDEMNTVRQTLRQQFGDDRQQLLALLDQPTLDQNRILELIQSHTRAINESAPVIVAAIGNFYDGLTPAQQAEVRDFVEQHRGHPRHRARRDVQDPD